MVSIHPVLFLVKRVILPEHFKIIMQLVFKREVIIRHVIYREILGLDTGSKYYFYIEFNTPMLTFPHMAYSIDLPTLDNYWFYSI